MEETMADAQDQDGQTLQKNNFKVFAGIILGILVAVVANYHSKIFPFGGPSVDEQITNIRSMVAAHDEIFVQGVATSVVASIDSATGDTTFVRARSLVQQLDDAQNRINDLSDSVGENRGSIETHSRLLDQNSGSIERLQTTVHDHADALKNAESARKGIYARMNGAETIVKALTDDVADNATGIERVGRLASAAEALAQRANTLSHNNAESVAALDQRMVALEAVNQAVYGGDRTRLVAMQEAGNASANFVHAADIAAELISKRCKRCKH
ncbi:MAG: hypothetical protein COU73_04435 [Parcubacteria group bacterium CG10_big_fil_rev_8_21_14_0_10_46_32]|nr:MAG: hypothetical protein COU73_04435 [Parcubacteria group bacterium CG10_big_fil_rev_8_21_14_0_10_46_32]